MNSINIFFGTRHRLYLLYCNFVLLSLDRVVVGARVLLGYPTYRGAKFKKKYLALNYLLALDYYLEI